MAVSAALVHMLGDGNGFDFAKALLALSVFGVMF